MSRNELCRGRPSASARCRFGGIRVEAAAAAAIFEALFNNWRRLNLAGATTGGNCSFVSLMNLQSTLHFEMMPTVPGTRAGDFFIAPDHFYSASAAIFLLLIWISPYRGSITE
jgi:hypothetical protein